MAKNPKDARTNRWAYTDPQPNGVRQLGKLSPDSYCIYVYIMVVL